MARDSVIFSAPKMPEDISQLDYWKDFMLEVEALINGFFPFFTPSGPRKDVVFCDKCFENVSGDCILMSPKIRTNYEATPPGSDHIGRWNAFLPGGGIEQCKIPVVCFNGFESAFFPSIKEAVNFSIEHQSNVVSWYNGEFINIFYDFRSAVERIISALMLIESAYPEVQSAIESDDLTIFIDWLRYLGNTKLKKNTRMRDIINGLLQIHSAETKSNLLFCAAFTVREFIRSMFGEDLYQLSLSRFKPFNDAKELPFFYFANYEMLSVCCQIIRYYSSDFSINADHLTAQKEGANTKQVSCKRDPLRTLPKQTKLAMWYAETAKNNGSGVFCSICGKKLTFDNFEVDHIYPWAKGGKTEPSNLQPLCKDCNRKKGASNHDEI